MRPRKKPNWFGRMPPSLVTDIKYNSGTNGGTISFKVDKENIRQGNALIAIKDSQNTILWSWHIWITDENIYHTIKVTNHQNVSHDLMPIHLGWCEGEVINYAARKAARYNSLPTGKRALLLSTKCAQLLLPKGTVLFTNGDAKTLCAHPAVMLTKNKTWYNAAGIASTANHAVESFPFGNECIKNYIRKPDVMQKEIGGRQYVLQFMECR